MKGVLEFQHLRPACGVFIANCQSVSVVFGTNDEMAIYDSHSHGRQGALVGSSS